jgi:hypothetical protein
VTLSDERSADLTPRVQNHRVHGVALQAQPRGERVGGYRVDHDRDEDPPLMRGQLVLDDADSRRTQSAESGSSSRSVGPARSTVATLPARPPSG